MDQQTDNDNDYVDDVLQRYDEPKTDNGLHNFLMVAVIEGDLDWVNAAIMARNSILEQDPHRTSDYAAKTVNINNKNMSMDFYERPLQLAAFWGQEEIIRRLLELPEALETLQSKDKAIDIFIHASTNVTTLKILLQNPVALNSLATKDDAPSSNPYITIFEQAVHKGCSLAVINCLLENPVFLANAAADECSILVKIVQNYDPYQSAITNRARRAARKDTGRLSGEAWEQTREQAKEEHMLILDRFIEILKQDQHFTAAAINTFGTVHGGYYPLKFMRELYLKLLWNPAMRELYEQQERTMHLEPMAVIFSRMKKDLKSEAATADTKTSNNQGSPDKRTKNILE